VAFTLLELLVVMGILLVLATLTAISVGKVTRDAKLANATNTLIASLGNARAIAIRDNTYVLVSFRIAPDRRSRIVPREPQVVQVITSKWTGEVVTPSTPLPAGVEMPSTADVYGERFLPVPGVPQRERRLSRSVAPCVRSSRSRAVSSARRLRSTRSARPSSRSVTTPTTCGSSTQQSKAAPPL
jgi:prepilin-type N-terminal cleavage/methylation domain-containing protein